MEVSRDGLILLALGCAPFAAGAIVPADGDTGLVCPFRELTGLPCPLCGATRAFALASRGDAGFTSYNAVWVVVAALLIVAGALILLTRRRPRLTPRVAAVLVAVAGRAGWAYALAERATIVARLDRRSTARMNRRPDGEAGPAEDDPGQRHPAAAERAAGAPISSRAL